MEERVIFIKNQERDENEICEAFEICKEHIDNICWKDEDELDCDTLQKNDVIVFAEFKGAVYETLKKSKCVRILGPRALISCVQQCKEIPNYPWPIWNIAMYGTVICCSQIPKEEKELIMERVSLMGGCYLKSLQEKTTHLITATPLSEKYLIAAKRGLKIMLPSWVEAIYLESQTITTNYDDQTFEKYKCLPFQNLVICTTGVDKAQQNELVKLIEQNGGTLSKKMEVKCTDILVCFGEKGLTGPKFKTACQTSKIKCVTIEWIYDSVKAGYALSTENYRVRNKATSTPTKMNVDANFSTLSVMSAIVRPDMSQMPSVDDSVNLTRASNFNFNKSPAGESEDTLAALLKNVDNFTENLNADQNTVSEQETSHGGIFSGLKFAIFDCSDEDKSNIIDTIQLEGGEIVENEDEANYKVLPPIINYEIQVLNRKVVNVYWICECVENEALLDLTYYHIPLFIENNTEILKNCVITISSYSGNERLFLRLLVNKLGGLYQDQLIRTSNLQKNVQASTHLVTPETSGKKYEAALLWKLPVITKDWLLDCARFKKLVPIDDYMLSKSLSTTFEQLSIDAATSSKAVTLKNDNSQENKENVCTPKKQKNTIQDADMVTPNRKFNIESETPYVASQVTPVDKILEEARRKNLLATPKTPESPKPSYWWDPKTPPTPEFGFAAKWSPTTRKEVEQLINSLPDFKPIRKRRPSTPLAELCKNVRHKFFPDAPDTDTNPETSHENEFSDNSGSTKDLVTTNIQQLENMVVNSETKRKSRCFQSILPAPTSIALSQKLTVSWDYTELKSQNERVFLISGLEEKQKSIIMSHICQLGGEIVEAYTPSVSHLLCAVPTRNEKVLSCIAAGKYILHASYIDKCFAEEKFIEEAQFEFGNPKCTISSKDYDRDTLQRMKSMYQWRKEIKTTGRGAFSDMKAIVVVKNRMPIINVIEAGGGTIIDITPPFKGKIDATHCIMEVKSVPDMSLYIPLAQQGIYCVTSLYISDVLHRLVNDPIDSVLAPFAKYYLRE